MNKNSSWFDGDLLDLKNQYHTHGHLEKWQHWVTFTQLNTTFQFLLLKTLSIKILNIKEEKNLPHRISKAYLCSLFLKYGWTLNTVNMKEQPHPIWNCSHRTAKGLREHLDQWFSNFSDIRTSLIKQTAKTYPSFRGVLDSVVLRWGQRICISNKLPGDAVAADLGPHLENHSSSHILQMRKLTPWEVTTISQG